MVARVLRGIIVLLPLVLLTAGAKSSPPAGLLVVSEGESVVIVAPATGEALAIPAGPVAWLFPAPGGTLFAPDLVHGTTTVIDLLTQTVRERLDGVTMPRFGQQPDRYVVVSKQLLVMSYPERALMNRFEIAFERPWQVEVAAGNTVLLVLERDPEGSGRASLVAVNLSEGRLVYRLPLSGDVRRFALSSKFHVVALADAEGRVVFAEPGTLTPRAGFETPGRAVDVVFTGDGSLLAVAVETADGAGELLIWKLKLLKDGTFERSKQWLVAIDGSPQRLVNSPDQRHVAVATAAGLLHVVDVNERSVLRTVELPGSPRDLVWCDPFAPGPSLPEWTDDDPPTLPIGG
jgi:hypothetical protein